MPAPPKMSFSLLGILKGEATGSGVYWLVFVIVFVVVMLKV